MCRLLGMKPGRKVEEAMQSVLYWKGKIENGCTRSKVRNISMDEFSHLKSKLLAEQVEEQIYHYILDTPLDPGSKLPNEFELGEKFGVGRSTIREAV